MPFLSPSQQQQSTEGKLFVVVYFSCLLLCFRFSCARTMFSSKAILERVNTIYSFSACKNHLFHYPAPGWGYGVLFLGDFFLSFFLCFFVSNTTRKRLDRFAWNFQGRCDHGTTWLHFGSIRVNGLAGQRSICLLSKLPPVELDILFALVWWQHFLSMAASSEDWR